jgi:hypothetical protein
MKKIFGENLFSRIRKFRRDRLQIHILVGLSDIAEMSEI